MKFKSLTKKRKPNSIKTELKNITVPTFSDSEPNSPVSKTTPTTTTTTFEKREKESAKPKTTAIPRYRAVKIEKEKRTINRLSPSKRASEKPQKESTNDPLPRAKRSSLTRPIEIKTKKRWNNNEGKIDVEKKAIKTSPEKQRTKSTIEPIDASPFAQFNYPKLDRNRAERASITSIERVSNSPLRLNKTYAKSPSSPLNLTSADKENFLDSPFSPFGRSTEIVTREVERAATSLGFVEERLYEDYSDEEDSNDSRTTTVERLDILNDTVDEEPSFDDGYYSLRTERNDDPWRNFENESMFANQHRLKSTPNLVIKEHEERDTFESNALGYIDEKRISALKRRSKNARYSVYQPCELSQENVLNKPFTPIANKFASETALSQVTRRKSIDRKRRGKEINRSMTLYWDDEVKSPTVPENLVFNVSMNAKISTCVDKDTILHTAASNGNIDIARFYVESDQYLNAQNGFRNTPLHCAIIGHHPEIINILVVKDLDISIQNIDGDTVFHLAARANMAELTGKLLAMNAESVNLQNKDGDTCLHIAVRENYDSVVSYLAECESTEIDVQNNEGDTALHISGNLSPDLKKKLLLSNEQQQPIGKHAHNHVTKNNELSVSPDEGAIEINQSQDDYAKCVGNLRDRNGNTLLHVFAAHNEAPLLQILLKLSCTKTKQKNNNTETALHVAIKNSNFNLTRVLITEDLELLNMGDSNGDTILHYAVQTGNITLTEELIKLGTDLNRQNDRGRTPLHCAVIGEFAAISKLLLSRNANLRLPDLEGEFPIHLVAKTKNEEIIHIFKELLSHSVNQSRDSSSAETMQDHADNGINFSSMHNGQGNSPLHVSVVAGNVAFFKNFVRNDSAHLTSHNHNGSTVLHLIAEYNRDAFLPFIDLSNVNANVLNNEGFTPWNIALRKEYSDVAMFLLQNKWNLCMDI